MRDIRCKAKGEREQFLLVCLFADATVLLAESERMQQGTVDEFNKMCKN